MVWVLYRRLFSVRGRWKKTEDSVRYSSITAVLNRHRQYTIHIPCLILTLSTYSISVLLRVTRSMTASQTSRCLSIRDFKGVSVCVLPSSSAVLHGSHIRVLNRVHTGVRNCVGYWGVRSVLCRRFRSWWDHQHTRNNSNHPPLQRTVTSGRRHRHRHRGRWKDGRADGNSSFIFIVVNTRRVLIRHHYFKYPASPLLLSLLSLFVVCCSFCSSRIYMPIYY